MRTPSKQILLGGLESIPEEPKLFRLRTELRGQRKKEEFMSNQKRLFDLEREVHNVRALPLPMKREVKRKSLSFEPMRSNGNKK